LARFCLLMVERDLFGTVRLVRNWGRIGTQGRELVEQYGTEIEAQQALAQAKRRRGYRGPLMVSDALPQRRGRFPTMLRDCEG
jgi:predicted DNA-binding WGR domain protein